MLLKILSPGELTNLIDSLSCSRFKVEINNTDDAVIYQTIHGAKGLEYPVVILANMNSRIFPSSKNSINGIYYNPVTGLRLRKQFGTIGEYSGVFDNFRSEILIKMMKTINYDEERRLLYVAVTRAKQYLYFTARKPSLFFTELKKHTGMESESDFNYDIIPVKYESDISSEEIELKITEADERKFVSVHSLMDEAGSEKESAGLFDDKGNIEESVEHSGIDADAKASIVINLNEALTYGNKIHLAAQKLARKSDIKIENEELKRISDFLNSCGAVEILPEVDFLYPKGNDIIRGTIDLLLIYDDRIEIVDYKTDKSKKYIDKYKKQLSIYRDVIKEVYPDKRITAKIFYTGLNEIMEV